MTISFTKKPVYTVNGQDYETLEAAQLVAIQDLHPLFNADGLAKIILDAGPQLTAIFRQTPRKNASPRKRGPAKPRAAAAKPGVPAAAV